MTVALRHRLAAGTGLRLPDTLGWDYGSVSGLARYLETELSGSAGTVALPSAASADEPIVVVGMGCRYPGVDSPRGLWDVVAAGRDVMSDFPTNRGWDVDGLYDPDPDVPHKTYTQTGGFVAGMTDFDANFFGIATSEALDMNPEQRQILEVTWEALEDAGIDPMSLRGTATGVFTGIFGQSYGSWADDALGGLPVDRLGGQCRLRPGFVRVGPGGPGGVGGHRVLVVAGGDALGGAVAAVGGVRPGAGRWSDGHPVAGCLPGFSRQRGLATGRPVQVVRRAADGTGWGEGAGVLVLERLSDARRLGHRVWRSSAARAINQDGASNGLTAPNGPSQQRVIRAALASAALTANRCRRRGGSRHRHQTRRPDRGTGAAGHYGHDRPADRPLWLGSIKSNMGHTQAAAGVAGVIKMVQAMRTRGDAADAARRRADPATWTGRRVGGAADGGPGLAGEGRPRRAGVSSFGISGTNAHVISGAGPAPESADERPSGSPDPGRTVMSALPWSCRHDRPRR